MTLTDLLPRLPLPHAEAVTYGMACSAALAQRLVQVQDEHPQQFRVTPLPLVDGRYFVWGGILSEVPGGLYAVPFSYLDQSKFDEIEVLPWSDVQALRPPDPPDEG